MKLVDLDALRETGGGRMITNPKEQKICDKYGKRDSDGFVHCNECPLRISDGAYDFRCKANSHYDRKKGEWEYDERTYREDEEG